VARDVEAVRSAVGLSGDLPGADVEKVRESVRLAVRRCATLWSGKKPIVEVTLARVGE
jgi:hypothetical protein